MEWIYHKKVSSGTLQLDNCFEVWLKENAEKSNERISKKLNDSSLFFADKRSNVDAAQLIKSLRALENSSSKSPVQHEGVEDFTRADFFCWKRNASIEPIKKISPDCFTPSEISGMHSSFEQLDDFMERKFLTKPFPTSVAIKKIRENMSKTSTHVLSDVSTTEVEDLRNHYDLFGFHKMLEDLAISGSTTVGCQAVSKETCKSLYSFADDMQGRLTQCDRFVVKLPFVRDNTSTGPFSNVSSTEQVKIVKIKSKFISPDVAKEVAQKVATTTSAAVRKTFSLDKESFGTTQTAAVIQKTSSLDHKSSLNTNVEREGSQLKRAQTHQQSLSPCAKKRKLENGSTLVAPTADGNKKKKVECPRVAGVSSVAKKALIVESSAINDVMSNLEARRKEMLAKKKRNVQNADKKVSDASSTIQIPTEATTRGTKDSVLVSKKNVSVDRRSTEAPRNDGKVLSSGQLPEAREGSLDLSEEALKSKNPGIPLQLDRNLPFSKRYQSPQREVAHKKVQQRSVRFLSDQSASSSKTTATSSTVFVDKKKTIIRRKLPHPGTILTEKSAVAQNCGENGLSSGPVSRVSFVVPPSIDASKSSLNVRSDLTLDQLLDLSVAGKSHEKKSVPTDDPENRMKKAKKIIANDLQLALREPKQYTFQGITARQQIQANIEKSASFAGEIDLTALELQLEEQKKITYWTKEKYNDLVRELRLPYFRALGCFWPALTPNDGILRGNSLKIVAERLLACKSHSSWRESKLLLTRRRDKRKEEFVEALTYFKTAKSDNTNKLGRFKNRVGYCRVASSQSREDGKEKNDMRQEEERKRIQGYEKGLENARRTEDPDLIRECKSKIMHHHVSYSNIDHYSAKRREARGAENPGNREDVEGTREWFHMKDRFYFRERNYAVVEVLNECNEQYLDRMPDVRLELFKEWALTPILAALKHQSKRSDNAERRAPSAIRMSDRFKIYSTMIGGKTPGNLNDIIKTCSIEPYEYHLLPIIWDQLSSHFKAVEPMSVWLSHDTDGLEAVKQSYRRTVPSRR
ncbi:unnamed protein product [Caenorhabditis auriculariae]|uniref:Uncharacterized protein n=1 Tax=Caenorhabditis auriculariae TaxID=2777116 RepID=A0A8S1HDI2_9PELO|nr:unnamed protein product [Caenorhabditis auriculariae]